MDHRPGCRCPSLRPRCSHDRGARGAPDHRARSAAGQRDGARAPHGGAPPGQGGPPMEERLWVVELDLRPAMGADRRHVDRAPRDGSCRGRPGRHPEPIAPGVGRRRPRLHGARGRHLPDLPRRPAGPHGAHRPRGRRPVPDRRGRATPPASALRVREWGSAGVGGAVRSERVRGIAQPGGGRRRGRHRICPRGVGPDVAISPARPGGDHRPHHRNRWDPARRGGPPRKPGPLVPRHRPGHPDLLRRRPSLRLAHEPHVRAGCQHPVRPGRRRHGRVRRPSVRALGGRTWPPSGPP